MLWRHKKFSLVFKDIKKRRTFAITIATLLKMLIAIFIFKRNYLFCMDGEYVKLCNINGDHLISLSYLFLHVLISLDPYFGNLKQRVIRNKPKILLLSVTLPNKLTDVHIWHQSYDSNKILMIQVTVAEEDQVIFEEQVVGTSGPINCTKDSQNLKPLSEPTNRILESCQWSRNKIFLSLDAKSGMLQLGTGW